MDHHENSWSGDVFFNAIDWQKLLHLVTIYEGKMPFLLHDDPLSEEELEQLAVSVEESLDDIPNHNATGGKRAAEMSPFEWFSGPRKEKLKDFVRFCREGRVNGG